MLKDLVTKCRSYRRFYEDVRISREELCDLVDTARLTGCTSNCQALKYKLLCTEEDCARIFPNVAWAGALTDWDGPVPGERPSAYIVILCDLKIAKNKQWDEGIAAQTIMLAATEKGYGGCMIASCKRSEILALLGLSPEEYSVGLVLALGKPKEEVHIVPLSSDGSTTYYRDENQVHYVPKRSLEDIIL
jgi:nitroreductase